MCVWRRAGDRIVIDNSMNSDDRFKKRIKDEAAVVIRVGASRVRFGVVAPLSAIGRWWGVRSDLVIVNCGESLVNSFHHRYHKSH